MGLTNDTKGKGAAPTSSSAAQSSMNPALIWTIVGILVVIVVGVIVWLLTAQRIGETGDTDAVLQGETVLHGGADTNGAPLQDTAPVTPPPSPAAQLDTPPLATEDIIVDDLTEELNADLSDLDGFANSDDLGDISDGLDDLSSF